MSLLPSGRRDRLYPALADLRDHGKIFRQFSDPGLGVNFALGH